ncbi:MAG TPA: flavodoxin domain-containing protein [Hyphomicrobiaceae bacterium]|nr:flavodoxin domain-containing protein [Hyphomicrobiaceae bacterium]
MKILLAFGTVEGHTRKVASTVKTRLEQTGNSVRSLDTSQHVPDLALASYDACIVAAPVHQQRHPDEVINFAKAHAAVLNGMRTALISVSLSAAFDGGQDEARGYTDRLTSRTEWNPGAIHLAAGALKLGEYDFFQEQIIRHVVLKDRAPQQLDHDHEFTDWDALGRFIDEFVE